MFEINDKKICSELNASVDPSRSAVEEILSKAKELKGISYHDVLTLLSIKDPELTNKLFDTAKYAKEQIYGNRLVLFAPLTSPTFATMNAFTALLGLPIQN